MNVLLPNERYRVAVHEAGHALVAAYSDEADPVSKVTVREFGLSPELGRVGYTAGSLQYYGLRRSCSKSRRQEFARIRTARRLSSSLKVSRIRKLARSRDARHRPDRGAWR